MYPNWEHWRDLQSIPFVRHKEKRNMRRMPLGTCIGADKNVRLKTIIAVVCNAD